jgi:thiopurine S-methyltransferase
MDATFWQQRWKENKTSFHEERPNALLSQHFHRLSLDSGSRVFVPLCGKSNDLAWLSERGHRVVGIELNQAAVEEAFSRMDRVPDVSEVGSLTLYRSDNFELFVGDVFDLSADLMGPVDAIYDRAALVALPAEMRRAYAAHLTALTNAAPQFLVSYEYDQSQVDGPPFSVTGEEIGTLYGDRYRLELVASVEISGPLSERCSGTENAWLLKPNW